MRDVLPVNGASAYNIPDPQARGPEVLAECANCGALLYSGDEVVRDECGELFCDEACYFDWLIWQGLASKVLLSSNGNMIVRGVG